MGNKIDSIRIVFFKIRNNFTKIAPADDKTRFDPRVEKLLNRNKRSCVFLWNFFTVRPSILKKMTEISIKRGKKMKQSGGIKPKKPFFITFLQNCFKVLKKTVRVPEKYVIIKSACFWRTKRRKQRLLTGRQQAAADRHKG